MGCGCGGRYIPIATLSPPEWTPCFEMGSDESHFIVPLVLRNSHKTVSTDHNF